MKHFNFWPIIGMYIAIFFALSASVYGNDHGDSIATATLVEINSTTDGELVESDEADYFKVVLTEETLLSVETLGDTDTYGFLLDSAGTQLAENDDGDSLNFRIVQNLPAGTYYVRVEGFEGTETGSYQFYVSTTSDDHGDDMANATLIEVETTTSGKIEWAEDVDYFKIVLTREESLLWMADAEYGIRLDLLNSDGEVLSSNDYYDYYDESRPVSMTLTAGTYYFALQSLYSETDSYKLFLSKETQTVAANDNFADRETLLSNTEKLGSLKGASSEGDSGEPDIVSWNPAWPASKDDLTLWYEWTAPAKSQWLRIDLMDLDVASVLSVYTGDDLQTLTKVGLNHRENPSLANRLILPVEPGTTYKIRVAAWYYDYAYSQMPGLNFKLRLTTLNTPVTSNDYVTRGRGELAKGTADGLSNAVADFAKALEKDSNNNEARLLHALGSLLNLEHEPAFVQTLHDIGLVKTGAFQEGGKITVPKDIDGDPIPAPNATSQIGIDWVNNEFLERINAMRNELSQITDDQFLTDLTSVETGGGSEVIIDKGDVLLLKAMTHGIEMVFNLIFTYDLNLPFETLVQFRKEGSLSAEKTLDTFDSLLSFAATDRRQLFDQDLRQMKAAYTEASDFIRNHNTPLNGIMSGKLSADANAEIQDSLTTLMTSLNGDPAYIGGREVNLSRLVATDMSIRDFLPTLMGDETVPGSLPDPTFDGILPGTSSRELDNMIFKLGSLGSMSQYIEDMETLMGAAFDYYMPMDMDIDAPAPFDDADGDGQSNFAEWIRGSDPFTRDVIWESLSRSVISPNQVDFKISFIRRKSLRDWNLEVWVSDDLVTWDKTETQIQMVGLPIDNGDGFSETVTYKLNNAAALSKSKFLQVQAVIKK